VYGSGKHSSLIRYGKYSICRIVCRINKIVTFSPDGVFDHGEVLLVEDIEDGVGEDVDAVAGSVVAVDHQGQVVGQSPGPTHGLVVVLGRFEDGVEGEEGAGGDAGDVPVVDQGGTHPDRVTVGRMSGLGAMLPRVILQEPG
jgi:hypothetical protein